MGLASGASFAGLELEGGSVLSIEQLDVREAFYRMALPEGLRCYFGMKRLAGHLMGRTGAAGRRSVYPRLRVLAMGWTWALWWSQSILQRSAAAAGLEERCRLEDGAEVPPLADFRMRSL